MNINVIVGRISNISHITGTLVLSAIAVMVVLEIMTRLARVTLMGLDELAGLFAVIMTFLGVSYVQRQKQHPFMEFVIEKMPPNVQIGLQWFNGIVMAIVCCVVIWQVSRLGLLSYMNQDRTLFLHFPLYIIRISVLLGIVLFLFEDCCDLIKLATNKIKEKETY